MKQIAKIKNILILSTDHVCQSTHDMLEAESILDSCPPQSKPAQRPPAAFALTVGRFGDFAWLMWVPPREFERYPADLEMIFEYTRQNACEYLLLEVEQDPVPGLPVYPKE